MKKIKIISIFMVLVLSSLACSSDFRNSIIDRLPEKVGEAISNPGQIATLVVDEVAELNNEGQESGNSTQPHFDDLAFGMNTLESFRFQFVQSLQGMDDEGNTTSISVVNDQEVIKSLQIVHMHMETTTEIKPLQILDVYRFGNEVFLLNEVGECTAFTENLDVLDADGSDLGLSSIFSNLDIGNLKQQGEMINGVASNRYQVKNVVMINSTLKNVDAEIWYAQEGGFIVKFAGEAQGEAYSETEGINVAGTIRWEYNLTDTNSIIEIPLPEKCQLAAEGGVYDLPVPENAQDLSIIGSMMSFNSPDVASNLADYYRLEMPVAGYTLSDETVYDDFYVITYIKAEETITIMISGVNSGGSDAIITVEVK
ncbi:MAG: hypothetical protein IH585_16495 [Anaerolineaceae bacterium]|nr:hypothetical protein [Anaerolineaceae bacterium]